MRPRPTLLLAVVAGLAPAPLSAQEPAAPSAAVFGRITDASTTQPIAGVLVEVEGTALNAVTDSTGQYRLAAIPAGPQVLRTERLGYAPVRLPITVPARGTVRRDVVLTASALEQEAIVVTADPVGRARGELGTASVVGREAIANQVAISLRGVLELVPGVAMTTPGLSGVQQVGLRAAPTTAAAAGEFAAFGTLIIVDGVPMSNNANLQRPPTGTSFSTSAGGGIDLRRIPASSIERVEVIRGIPSARYGDLTQGAIVVETRTGAIDPELAVQVDPQMQNVSLVAGRPLGGRQAGAITLDVARQQPNAGIRDDEAHRVAFQLKHRGQAGVQTGPGDALLVMDTRVDAFQVLDDRPVDPEDVAAFATSVRDRGVRLAERARLRVGASSQLELTAALELTEQSSTWQSMRTSAAMPFTDRLTEGRATGRFIAGPYLAELEVDGAPRLGYGRLEYQVPTEWFGLGHDLRAGIEARREWNSGPGYQFDLATPPQVSANGIDGFDRPRPYDDFDALALSAFYIDDRLSHAFGRDGLLNIQAGIRADALHEGGTWFSGARDVVVQPRVNAEIGATSWLRLRGGWGRVAKAPSVGRLSPEPRYFDIVNVNWFANDPAERLAVITTYVRDPSNPELGFAVADKAEAGIEIGSGEWAVALVAFNDKVTGAFGSRIEPQWLGRERFQLSDSSAGTGVPPMVIEPPSGLDTIPILVSRPDNNIDVDTHGFELTTFLPEIRPLRTRIQLQAQWIETRQTGADLDLGSSLRFRDFQFNPNQERLPFWDAAERSGRSVLATYRVIHHQPDIGLVLTGTIQHNVLDRVWDRGATDTLAFAGYITRTGDIVRVPAGERTRPEYQDLRVPRSTILTDLRETPADWMLSIQVRKTLPIDGHLSFWAFNAMDRPGYLLEADVQPRSYGRTRFGLELVLPLRGLWGGS